MNTTNENIWLTTRHATKKIINECCLTIKYEDIVDDISLYDKINHKDYKDHILIVDNDEMKIIIVKIFYISFKRDIEIFFEAMQDININLLNKVKNEYKIEKILNNFNKVKINFDDFKRLYKDNTNENFEYLEENEQIMRKNTRKILQRMIEDDIMGPKNGINEEISNPLKYITGTILPIDNTKYEKK